MEAVQEAVEVLHTVVSAMPGGGESRPGQVEMCEAVAEAFTRARHLVVAAGTGTGKSMAYLAPLAASDKKAVVATATKALQDQLVNKDLPLLVQTTGVPLTFAVLKGRSNYLCRKKLADFAAGSRGEQQLIATDSAVEAETVRAEVKQLAVWADLTTDGDRAGLDFEPSSRAWEAVSVSGRECPGAANCVKGEDCFAEQARDRAAQADVVVVNHHLYCLDVFTDAEILPPHDAVVFDEAHTLEDIAATAAGVSITGGRFRYAARAVKTAVRRSNTADAVSAAGDILRAALEPYRDELLSSLPDGLIEAVAVCRGRLNEASAEVRESSGDETRRRMALRLLDALINDLDGATDPDNDDAVWVEGVANNPIWRTAPVDVGPALCESLWRCIPAVLTSATVPVNLADRLGLPDDESDDNDVGDADMLGANGHDRIDVGSPFEYRRSGLLYCAKHLPPPNDSSWIKAVQPEITRLTLAAGGRTLALFTSYKAMRAGAETVRATTDLRVYCQDDLPNRELIRRFAEEQQSCLFATMTMWQGIDVPGPSLSLVIVDRIPFPRPDEPLMVARRERIGRQAFHTIDVPRATTLLAQGAGRLIRSAQDRGVVAVLDSRLATASYRKELLGGLPPFRRTIEFAEVETFFADIAHLIGALPHRHDQAQSER